MLKKRIIAVLVAKDDIIVQSIGFEKYLPVGKPLIAVEFLNQWGIDEIVLLDISASKNHRSPNFQILKSAAEYCRVPMAVGGGIRNLEHVHKLMQCGADKIVFNQAILQTPELITEAARLYGDQCIVASIDAKWTPDGYRVYDYLTKTVLNTTPAEFAARLQTMGAGEIFLNSVDRDGMKTGFDIELIKHTSLSLTIPLIVCGGAGTPQHFLEVLGTTTASAVAAANFFHFYEHSVTIAKSFTSNHYPIRHETQFQYKEHILDVLGRPLKKSDAELENLLYQRIEKEVI
jgi:cyclase